MGWKDELNALPNASSQRSALEIEEVDRALTQLRAKYGEAANHYHRAKDVFQFQVLGTWDVEQLEQDVAEALAAYGVEILPFDFHGVWYTRVFYRIRS